MKDLTITIKPPITEYCSKCDYEASYSFSGCRAECPKCGGSVYSGRRKNKDILRVIKHKGRYDLLSNEEQYQYVFFNLPKECGSESMFFVVDKDLDESEPIELAFELQNIYDKYIYTKNKEKIKKLIDVIGKEEFIESQDQLKIQEKKKKLEFEIFKLNSLTFCYEIV